VLHQCTCELLPWPTSTITQQEIGLSLFALHIYISFNLFSCFGQATENKYKNVFVLNSPLKWINLHSKAWLASLFLVYRGHFQETF